MPNAKANKVAPANVQNSENEANEKAKELSNVVLLPEGLGTRKASNFDKYRTQMTSTASKKAQIICDAKQSLSHAVDLLTDGSDAEIEAETISGKVAATLYQAVTENILTADEVTAVLGDVFGFKMKGDAKTMVRAGDKNASKTPYGRGDAIRQRISRLVSATEYVEAEGEEGTNFFLGLPVDEVSALLDEVKAGETPVFTAYKTLQEMRRQANPDRLPFHEDVDKLAGFIAALSEPATISRIINDDGLMKIYALLGEALNVIEHVDPDTLPAAA